jgi:hypothetical protein
VSLITSMGVEVFLFLVKIGVSRQIWAESNLVAPLLSLSDLRAPNIRTARWKQEQNE